MPCSYPLALMKGLPLCLNQDAICAWDSPRLQMNGAIASRLSHVHASMATLQGCTQEYHDVFACLVDIMGTWAFCCSLSLIRTDLFVDLHNSGLYGSFTHVPCPTGSVPPPLSISSLTISCRPEVRESYSLILPLTLLLLFIILQGIKCTLLQ